MFRSLRHRDFRLFWLGLGFALTGFQVQRVGLGFLAYDLTGSALYLTLVFLGDSAPMLLFAPIGGVIGDRVNRKLVIMVSRCTIAALAVLICLLVFSGLIAAWHLLVFSLLTGVCYAFDLPARQAMIRDLVPDDDFVNAVGLSSSVMQGSRIVGPAIGGIALTLVGAGGTFALMAAGQLGQVLMVAALTVPHVLRPPAQSVAANMREGFAFIIRHETIWMLMLVATIPALFATNYASLTPVFALDVLSREKAAIGVMFAAAGVGALAGSMAVAAYGETLARPRASALFAAAFGVSVVAFALSGSYPLSLMLLVVVGALGSAYSVGNSSALQTRTPREMQGRVMGVYQITWNAQFFGALLIGALADAAGAPFALVLAGLLTAAAVLALLALRPSLRRG
jgi:MFS family permease